MNRGADPLAIRTHRASVILRNPRVIVPPSQRIPNWRSLPVEGAGKKPSDPTAKFFVCGGLAILGLFVAEALRGVL